jgi:DNA-directed RNA polymerase subunit N (RpoN/RPB10)
MSCGKDLGLSQCGYIKRVTKLEKPKQIIHSL